MSIFRLFVFSTVLFFSGCAQKSTLSKPVYIQIKTPQIAISDAGFLNITGEKKELVVLGAGNALFKLTLNHLACLNGECTTRADILARLSLVGLPDMILDDILEAKEIQNTKSKTEITKRDGGFEQRLQSNDFDIAYSVEAGTTSFIEKKNRIFIKITEIDK